MRFPVNCNDTINDFARGEWHLLTRRADISPLPVFIKIKGSSPSYLTKKLYGGSIPWLCFWYGDTSEFYLHGSELRSAIKSLTKVLYSLSKTKAHVAKVEAYCKQACKLATVFENHDLSKWTNKELLKHYKAIIKPYISSYEYGFIAWCIQVIEKHVKEIINNKATVFSKLNLTPASALNVLISSDKSTLYNKKDEALNILSKYYQHHIKIVKDEAYIKAKYPKINDAINKFLSLYRWVGYEYNGPALNYKDVVSQLVSNTENKHKTMDKKAIIRTGGFTQGEKDLFTALSLVSYIKDERNSTDDYVHYCLDNFYEEVGHRSGLTKAEIKFLWSEELVALLNGSKVTKKYIKDKKKYCAGVTMARKIGLKDYYFGSRALALRRAMASKLSFFNQKTSVSLRGNIAASGLVRGCVKIVNSYKDINKVQRGDVLVAYMTTPKFMPAILRCAAIVTNDGGLTCHAAIIAREIKKPCIVGTKIATEVFKDGDRVEVDANNGIVRKI